MFVTRAAAAAPAVPIPKLDGSVGVDFIALIMIAVLFGVTNVQAFLYFSMAQKDRTILRYTIGFLWILDAFHLAILTHRMYFTVVSHFGDITTLLPPYFGIVSDWSFSLWCITSVVSDTLVRIVFASRTYRFSKGNKVLLAALIISIVVVLAFGIAFPIDSVLKIAAAVKLLEAGKPFTIPRYSWSLLGYLITIVLSDGLISISLCVLLWRSRTGIKKTDSTLRVLMLYSINTGLLTSFFATMAFLLFVTLWPYSYAYAFFYALLPKLYFNALLANLNARHGLHSQNATALSFSLGSSSRDMAFRKGQSSASDLGKRADPNQITINVETVIEGNMGSNASWEPRI